jgi:UDP-N-acetylglucosamine--N-acetylmuramyl-(pentapeptide) pyrophosphoryl-undecaprenol N-acetylglucosamine transferase
MVEVGAATLVGDDEFCSERLAAELDNLLADPARLEAMGKAARSLAHPDAAGAVAALVEQHAGRWSTSRRRKPEAIPRRLSRRG